MRRVLAQLHSNILKKKKRKEGVITIKESRAGDPMRTLNVTYFNQFNSTVISNHLK